MLLLPGSDALSAPRFARLSAQIANLDASLMLKRAFYVYAIDAAGEVDSAALAALLQPGTSAKPSGGELDEQEIVIVAPRFGTISPEDVNLFHRSDSVDDAFDYITTQLTEYAVGHPGLGL